MRAEYVQAIDDVRWGISFWPILIIPAGLLWYAAFGRRIGCLYFAAAWTICWLLFVIHADHIQSTKLRLAVTAEERWDVDNDTWFVYVGGTAIFYSLVYVTANARLAHIVASGGRWLSKRGTWAGLCLSLCSF